VLTIYTDPTFTITYATITVSTVDATGVITGVNLTTTGSLTYTQTFGVPLTGGHGTGATVNINLTITSVTVVNKGSGYGAAPVLTVTGGGAGLQGADLTASISGTTMTITHATPFVDRYIAIGQTVNGAGVASGTVIVKQLSGSPGLSGTWQVSISQTKADGVIYTSGTGAVITANLNISASGSSIATYGGRVWISSGRTIIFSAPNSYNNFDPTQLAGSLVMTDETMKGSIVRLFSTNNFLYIIGQNSINTISNVTTTSPQLASSGTSIIVVTAATTIFSNTNITSSIGTTNENAIVSYYRSIMFATDYGVMSLTGSTPLKISDPLDGMYQNIDFTQSITGGVVMLFNILCLCYLVKYNDPATGITRQLLCLFFNKKWYFSSQIEGMNFIATAYPVPDVPSLWATNGTSLYKLFSNSTGTISQIIKTKLWDMGNPLITKQLFKLGLETISTLPSALSINIDTDSRTTNYATSGSSIMLWFNNTNTPIVWTNNLSQPITWFSSGYVFSKQDISNVGNYVGITATATTPAVTYTGFHLQYEPRTPWAYTPF
jgi:hypothetical protein